VYETLRYQTGCFEFMSSAGMDLFLKPNSSVMSVSFHNFCGVLYTAAGSTSVLPIGMQTSVVSTSLRGGKAYLCVRDSFLNYNDSSAFVPVFTVRPIIVIVWNVEPHMRFQACP
jgi:hypothetical protein